MAIHQLVPVRTHRSEVLPPAETQPFSERGAGGGQVGPMYAHVQPLLLVLWPGTPSSFLFVVARPGAPNSVLARRSKARSP